MVSSVRICIQVQCLVWCQERDFRQILSIYTPVWEELELLYGRHNYLCMEMMQSFVCACACLCYEKNMNLSSSLVICRVVSRMMSTDYWQKVRMENTWPHCRLLFLVCLLMLQLRLQYYIFFLEAGYCRRPDIFIISEFGSVGEAKAFATRNSTIIGAWQIDDIQHFSNYLRSCKF